MIESTNFEAEDASFDDEIEDDDETWYRIEIDGWVYGQLQEEATPWVDSPNDVLRRLLVELSSLRLRRVLRSTTEGDETRPTHRRLRPGLSTPSSVFRGPIIDALYQNGGSASRQAVLEAVRTEMENVLNDYDLEYLPNGRQERWLVKASWEASRMQKDGLITMDHGWWELTAAGKMLAERRIEPG